MAFIDQTKIKSPQTAFYTRSPIFRVKNLIVDKNYNTYTQLRLDTCSQLPINERKTEQNK